MKIKLVGVFYMYSHVMIRILHSLEYASISLCVRGVLMGCSHTRRVLTQAGDLVTRLVDIL